MNTATQILEQLSQAEIATRLEQLDAEAKALRVLLRAARQRDRATKQSASEGTADAS